MKKFIFTLLILIGGIFVVGRNTQVEAYHLNEEGNVVSDNILNLNDVTQTTINGITYSVNDGAITLNGTSESYTTVNINLPINLSLIGNYSLNIFSENISFDCGLARNQWDYNYYVNKSNGTQVYTIDSQTAFSSFRIYIPVDTTINNLQLRPMLVKGSTVPINYESYGTFYRIDDQNRSFNVASATATWSGQSTAIDVMDKLIVHSDTLYLEDIITYTDSSNIEITINLASTLSTDLLYAFRFQGNIGSAIYIYQNENLIYNIESEECENNICVIDLSETEYSNFNKIVVTGANQDYYPIAFSYFSNLYQAGYDSGYHDGHYDGDSEGYKRGYNLGYTTGNSQAELDIYGFLPGIIGAILSFFYTIMQFSVFGISLFDIFVLFFGISMVILILKIINGGGD